MSVHVGKRETSLGVRCDRDLGIVTPTPERCALLDQSFLAQLTGHKITGNGIRQAVGHVEGRCLFRRPFLSVFYCPYKFISKMGERSCSVSGLTGCPDFGSGQVGHIEGGAEEPARKHSIRCGDQSSTFESFVGSIRSDSFHS